MSRPRIKLSTAIDRWIRLGPWYAMFPMEFAVEMICRYTAPGDLVLDPFLGRGTTVCAAAANGRHGVGVEINPVAWVYGKTKIAPASMSDVVMRLHNLAALSESISVPKLPEFFQWAYEDGVLRFLLAARKHLDWRNRRVDRTLMALILTDLHGREDSSLSNQMRQTKAMAPDYSVRWWKERNMRPREKDAVDILLRKIRWRYHHGTPDFSELNISVRRGDSIKVLSKVSPLKPAKLLLTSPPYFRLVNYHYDQWLRRWMLGGPELPKHSAGRWENRFENEKEYRQLLASVFAKSSELLAKDATVVVRTDARQKTFGIVQEVLRTVFPEKAMVVTDRPVGQATQTILFGDCKEKPGERDIVLN